MSMGYGFRARLLRTDDEKVLYEYGSFNWNYEKSNNLEYEMDGSVLIKKEVFPKIEHFGRNSRKAEEQKGAIKKVINNRSIEEMIENDFLSVQNSRYCWYTSKDYNIDIMAIRLITKVLNEYVKTGMIPEMVSELS